MIGGPPSGGSGDRRPPPEGTSYVFTAQIRIPAGHWRGIRQRDVLFPPSVCVCGGGGGSRGTAHLVQAPPPTRGRITPGTNLWQSVVSMHDPRAAATNEALGASTSPGWIVGCVPLHQSCDPRPNQSLAADADLLPLGRRRHRRAPRVKLSYPEITLPKKAFSVPFSVRPEK